MGFLRHLEGDQTDAWGYHVGQWYEERFRDTLTVLGFEDLQFELTESGDWHRVPLKNIAVKARAGAARSRSELLKAADPLLWRSTVADTEQPSYEAWRRQLRSFLETGEASAPTAHEPLAPMGRA
jgi:hypothetical protein